MHAASKGRILLHTENFFLIYFTAEQNFLNIFKAQTCNGVCKTLAGIALPEVEMDCPLDKVEDFLLIGKELIYGSAVGGAFTPASAYVDLIAGLIFCGRCAGKCPFGVTAEYQTGYKVYIGGRWGKKIAHGRPLDRIFTSEEEVLDLVERAILLFRDEGQTGERFADTVTRLGFDYVQDKLLNADINKDAILHKTVKGGATC